MKKPKPDSTILSISRHLTVRTLLFVFLIYFVFFVFQFPFLFSTSSSYATTTTTSATSIPRTLVEEETTLDPSLRPSKLPFSASAPSDSSQRRPMEVSGLVFDSISWTESSLPMHKAAAEAWKLGKEMFLELQKVEIEVEVRKEEVKNRTVQSCPHSIVLSQDEFKVRGKVMELPCGLTLGSHLTVVGKPYNAHPEYDPKITMRTVGDKAVMVSQFMMELTGLKIVDGEEPPRILHFNPRLKGDWSSSPVIEMNTCYRMQWGIAQRCEGWKSRADEETVDELVKCEKWIRDDDKRSEESKTLWWLNRLIGRSKKELSFDWPYPFVEDKLFVLTLSAGLEGYHINVDGRHVTSFPYRTGFVLEDATGLSLYGDIDVQSIFAGSLPSASPSFSREKFLEMSSQWRAQPLPDGPIELFIGILSAGNHFAERMAVRKSWMQSIAHSQSVVARFFVAMNGRKEVNVELKKEAEFFGDIVIVPYLDSYDLVVLKTVAICEYGVRSISANYIMKCDDDTFVNVNSMLREVRLVPRGRSLYVGNINFYHTPLRFGKWAVTYEEWPEAAYPPYADGPGYVISSDVAQFITSEFEKHKLRLFKMEDVSMGMWVEKYNSSRTVQYVHSERFCQFGCINNYYTAHYQSPRQMLCMWEKLRLGIPECCNMR